MTNSNINPGRKTLVFQSDRKSNWRIEMPVGVTTVYNNAHKITAEIEPDEVDSALQTRIAEAIESTLKRNVLASVGINFEYFIVKSPCHEALAKICSSDALQKMTGGSPLDLDATIGFQTEYADKLNIITQPLINASNHNKEAQRVEINFHYEKSMETMVQRVKEQYEKMHSLACDIVNTMCDMI